MIAPHSPALMLFGFVHSLGALLFFLGIGALIVWAFKKWTKEEFKKVGTWLVVIGTVLCVLSLGLSFKMRKSFGGKMMMIRGDAPGGASMGGMMRTRDGQWKDPSKDYIPTDGAESSTVNP